MVVVVVPPVPTPLPLVPSQSITMLLTIRTILVLSGPVSLLVNLSGDRGVALRRMWTPSNLSELSVLLTRDTTPLDILLPLTRKTGLSGPVRV